MKYQKRESEGDKRKDTEGEKEAVQIRGHSLPLVPLTYAF